MANIDTPVFQSHVVFQSKLYLGRRDGFRQNYTDNSFPHSSSGVLSSNCCFVCTCCVGWIMVFLQATGVRGPFLVVAPLSTLANWQRECETWSDINAIVYHGSLQSRRMIGDYEMYHRDEKVTYWM